MILTHVGYSVSFRVNDVTAQWLLQSNRMVAAVLLMAVAGCQNHRNIFSDSVKTFTCLYSTVILPVKILKVLFYNYFLLLP